MFNWFGKFLCLVTVIAVTDAHLVFTQGWAWSTMLQDRAPERGMVEAIESTFNGAEPCPMCCAVRPNLGNNGLIKVQNIESDQPTHEQMGNDKEPNDVQNHVRYRENRCHVKPRQKTFAFT